MKQKQLKEMMPRVAALIDDLVAVFGKDEIHGQVRKGLAGEPTFWASENGHEIGTRFAGQETNHD
jgi:hypothetical protein